MTSSLIACLLLIGVAPSFLASNSPELTIELEKFKSEIDDVVGEPKEEFVEEVNRLKSMLNFSFDSRYNPELTEAIEKMGIEQEAKTQVSLDDGTTNVLSPTEKDTEQNFGEFKGNIGIVNSGEFEARNDGATPISNRRATSDYVTNFS